MDEFASCVLELQLHLRNCSGSATSSSSGSGSVSGSKNCKNGSTSQRFEQIIFFLSFILQMLRCDVLHFVVCYLVWCGVVWCYGIFNCICGSKYNVVVLVISVFIAFVFILSMFPSTSFFCGPFLKF